MIVSDRSQETESFAVGRSVAAFRGIEKQAAKWLATLHAISDLGALRAFASAHLDTMGGERAGRYAIASTCDGACGSSGHSIRPDLPTSRLVPMRRTRWCACSRDPFTRG